MNHPVVARGLAVIFGVSSLSDATIGGGAVQIGPKSINQAANTPLFFGDF